MDHFTKTDYQQIYEPAQDSFLFLDSLAQEADFLKKKLKPKIVVEIGFVYLSVEGLFGRRLLTLLVRPGSGIVSTFVARILGPQSTYFCLDINDKACLATRQTASVNLSQAHILEPIRTNLFSGCEKLKGKIDLLLFNPPVRTAACME